MERPHLPNRLIAYGHEPNNERVNTYQKMSVIALIKSTMDLSEIQIFSESQFGKLLEMQSKPVLSGICALLLLYRQLVGLNKNEIWFFFAGYPIRFSLREFKIITGLKCEKFPRPYKKRKKVTAKSKNAFYKELYRMEGVIMVGNVIRMLKKKTVKDPHMSKNAFYKELYRMEGVIMVGNVIRMLKKKTVKDPQMRLRYVCHAIFAPTTHFLKLKINREHVEMTRNLDDFLAYLWRRKSFEMIISSLKERDITQFVTANIAIQGFFDRCLLNENNIRGYSFNYPKR